MMEYNDHFHTTTFYRSQQGQSVPVIMPIEVGALALDGFDPTYGDTGLKLGPQVYECLTCGAAVLNPDRHVQFHSNLNTGDNSQ